MANVANGLTEKMKRFAREYYANGGNGTEAYLAAYDTENRVTASREAHELLKRGDILEYIKALNIPQENKAISERDKKRRIIWERIQYCIDTNDDGGVARYMDILNKMDAEYTNVNHNLNETKLDLSEIDLNALKQLSSES
jgi:hypothetical protein